MKKVLKYLGKGLLIILILLSIYLVAAFGLSRIGMSAEQNQPDNVTIYIITNGVHTDIVMPTVNTQMDWRKEAQLSNITSLDTSFQYLAVGWGDKGFYLETPTWADLKASTAFKAAFGLNTTALHATYYKSMTIGPTCRQIDISSDQYARLINYVTDSAQKDENGHWINIKTTANYNKRDAFYEAKGRYSLFYTCNVWANNALKESGQKYSFWTPFDTGIFLNYEDQLSYEE